ncbi:MAG: hypothetical protein WA941_13085 [Nitrososphaeraceae archaeon]
MHRLQKWTQSTVWYLFQPIMEAFGIEVNRNTITGYIRDICKAAGVTRESLGIFAGARAELYFDGGWSSVSFGKIKELAGKGTDIVCIEKQGVPEVLTDWADKYGIALLNSRGHLTEYGKDLMDAARTSGALVVIMVDYDLPGIKIASETPTDMPWIGVSFKTLEYFHLTKEEVSIPAESDQYEKYVTELVKYSIHPDNAKSDNAGEFDDRFESVDLEFLMHRRIEIDAILAKVGDERFFEFIMYKLKEISPNRDYNRAITISTELFNKDNFDLLPEPVKKFLTVVQNVTDEATSEVKETIETELSSVEGFIEVPDKEKEIADHLTEAISENEKMKEISSECESSLTIGAMADIIDETEKAEEDNGEEDEDSDDENRLDESESEKP